MTEVKVIKERLKEVIKNKGKVILSGTHGSGKTTLCEKFLPYFKTFPEMTRELESSKNSVFRFRPGATQEELDSYVFSEIALLEMYTSTSFNVDIVTRYKPALYDRHVFDPIFYIGLDSYMTNFVHTRPVKPGAYPVVKKTRLYDYAMECILNIIQSGFLEDAIILVPLPLPLDTKDTFRLEGEELQRVVFENAVNTYSFFKIPFYCLQADVISNMIEEALVELGIKK
jgi:hypothetical protein